MNRKYIELIRYSSKGEERFSYTKVQWRLAWLAVFVLKDRSVFDSLTDEDKLFLHDQQFEVYKVWKK